MDYRKLCRQIEKPFDDFTFFSLEDRKRCIDAVLRSALPDARRNLFLLTGPPEAGKSRLIRNVRWFFGLGDGESCFGPDSLGQQCFSRWIESNSRRGKPIVTVEAGTVGKRKIGSAALVAYLSSTALCYRKLFEPEEKEHLRPAIWCELHDPRDLSSVIAADTLRCTSHIRLIGCSLQPTDTATMQAARRAVTRLRGLVGGGLLPSDVDRLLAPYAVQR